MTAPTEDLIALLDGRCAAIDLHYSRFPNSLDRTMEDTAKAIRGVVEAFRTADARLHAITHEKKCPRCELTKAQCADTIAEFEVERRSALTGSAQG